MIGYGLLKVGGVEPGYRPRTALVCVEAARNGEVLARRVDNAGVPTNKNAYWRPERDLLASFARLPTRAILARAKASLPTVEGEQC